MAEGNSVIIEELEIVMNTVSLGEGNGNPLQYSCLEKPMNRGAWQATVLGVASVGHNLATKPPPPLYQTSGFKWLFFQTFKY